MTHIMTGIDTFLAHQPADDWTLLALLVLFLVSCLLFGPLREQLRTSLIYVYRIRNSNAEFKTVKLSPFQAFSSTVVSVMSISFASALTGAIPEKAGTHVLLTALHASVYILPCYLLRQLLLMAVNARMYASGKISVEPQRWNALNLTMLSFMGIVSLIVCLAELFVPLPSAVYVILLLFFVLVCLYGEIVKAKSALFSDQCRIFGIFLYLCALEIGPLVPVLFLMGTNILFL